MILTKAEKIKFMKRLSWDYDVSCGDMLDVVEGRASFAGDFDREKLFARSLERMPWHYVVALWGVDAMNELYTDRTRAMLWPAERKEMCDASFSILRGESLPHTGWDTPRMRGYKDTFLSDRWDRA
jgi:hypothetical protein